MAETQAEMMTPLEALAQINIKPKAGKTAKPEGAAKITVTVVSKFDRFVDLINNVEITQSPTEVKMHPWLQSQVDSGKVLVV